MSEAQQTCPSTYQSEGVQRGRRERRGEEEERNEDQKSLKRT